MPGAVESEAAAQLAHELEHPFPFREDDDLHVGVVATFGEDRFEFRELRAGAVIFIEDEVRVADHAHHREFAHQPVQLRGQQRAALGLRAQFRDDALVALVGFTLRLRHRHEAHVVGAGGEFGFDVGLAAPQHHGTDPLVQAVEVAVARRAALFVERVELAVEAEERAEDRRREEIDDGVELVDAVLDGRAGEHERVATLQALDGTRGFGGPVLDALGLVEHDHVGSQPRVEVERVGHDLFVIAEGEEWRAVCVIVREAGEPAPVDDLQRERGEAADLFLPLGLERGGCHHQHTTHPAEAVQKRASGDCLDRLAQAHLVGQQGAFGEREMQHAFALVGKQRHQRLMRRPLAGLHAGLIFASERKSLGGATPALQPGLDFQRQTHVVRGASAQALDEFLGRDGLEPAGVIEQRAQRWRQQPDIAFDHEGGAIRGGRDVDERRTGDRTQLPCTLPRALRARKHGLDVLARAKAVDAEIRAGARRHRGVSKFAKLHRVRLPAPRADFVATENRGSGFEPPHCRGLLLRAQPSAQPLVGIAGAPVMDGWQGGFLDRGLGRAGALNHGDVQPDNAGRDGT